MVRNNRRKAFTIVELVIVIAVIAILAAVMIPTFTGIIKRANISADEQLAASINTQLSIYKAEGNKIETEADLIKALKSDADFTAQLNPKSAKHGYHYWYNAEKQTVELISNEDLLDPDKREQLKFNAGGNGVNVGFAHAAPRTIFPGFYLLDQIVDGKGNEISKFFAVLDGKEALGAEYLEALTALTEVKGDNKNLADAIIARMKATVVISNSGVFYHAETTANAYYYFIPGTASVKATQYKFSGETITPVSGGNLPTPKNNQIVLPSSIALIEKNALKFATANSVTVATSFETPEDLAEILAADCSNAIFTILNGNAYVVNGNELHINGGAKVCDLAKRLPFSDFRIAIASDANPTLYTISGNDTDGYTLYVLITQFDGKVTLHAKDAAEGSAATSSEVNKWSVSEEDKDRVQVSSTGVLTFDPVAMQQSGDYTAIITANAINNQLDPNQNKVSRSIKLEVVRATAATVEINGEYYSLGQNHDITLTYDGPTTTYDVVLYSESEKKVTYTPDRGIGTGALTITADEDSVISVANNKTLSFIINDENRTETKFTVSVDGCLETTFTVHVENTELANYKHTFHKSYSPDRPFYIGEGNAIPLSWFTQLKDGEVFNDAIITIYDRRDDGKYYNVNQINNTKNGISATILYNNDLSDGIIETVEEWNATTIQFDIVTTVTDFVVKPSYEVYVQITDGDGYSVVFTLNLVENAINVDETEFLKLGNVGSSVVLHGDVRCDENEESIPNTLKINLGAHTLYGNGYIINATSYKSNSTDTSKLDDYFITVNNGTIDNVYIDGPIYPEFVYDKNTNGYYVTGIITNGTSTIKNSYVAGFRQPVALKSGILNVNNTTLYGGTYANLQVINGTLNLTNVTTVQPGDGIENTFGVVDDENKLVSVIGLGIAVEYDALSGNGSEINVYGYLDQYNWVSKNTKAKLPSFTVKGAKMDFDKILAAMFNGVDIDVELWLVITTLTKPIDKRLNFLDHYFYKDSTYLNAGIMFITLGDNAPTAKGNQNMFNVHDYRGGSNLGGATSYVEIKHTAVELFSTYSLLKHDALFFLGENGITAAHAMIMLDKLNVDPNNGGKLTGTIGWDAVQGLLNPVDACIRVWSYSNENEVDGEFGPDKAVYTGGYYKDYTK